ncbi:MAG: globin [Microthrixaceae bacterium]
MSLGIGPGPPAAPLYERVGGHEFFVRLVDEFYVRVEADAELLAHYPEPEDLQPARDRLRMFLEQFWGGPTTYSDQRGHPRLRMRHAPFRVDADARNQWLAAMAGAVEALKVAEPERSELLAYFVSAADHLVNS